ncbi:hypothetical protein [Halosolutus halophilus]|nr:hypothetical protein [Halosolutus halophilus]
MQRVSGNLVQTCVTDWPLGIDTDGGDGTEAEPKADVFANRSS